MLSDISRGAACRARRHTPTRPPSRAHTTAPLSEGIIGDNIYITPLRRGRRRARQAAPLLRGNKADAAARIIRQRTSNRSAAADVGARPAAPAAAPPHAHATAPLSDGIIGDNIHIAPLRRAAAGAAGGCGRGRPRPYCGGTRLMWAPLSDKVMRAPTSGRVDVGGWNQRVATQRAMRSSVSSGRLTWSMRRPQATRPRLSGPSATASEWV